MTKVIKISALLGLIAMVSACQGCPEGLSVSECNAAWNDLIAHKSK